ncbi:MAG: hypothetical protein HY399_09105, partial [Elusimicrobia bacterium]|nr:hypothetical protein [Elusimicrobiota bacterium]
MKNTTIKLSARTYGWFAVALLTGHLSITQAQTPCDINITSLPATLSQAGATYCVTSNITGASGGFDIRANNIILDGQGHTITGNAEISNYKWDNPSNSWIGYSGTIIKNINLPGGINLEYSNNHQVLNSTFTGLVLQVVSSSTIQGNVINAGSGYAAIQNLGAGPAITGGSVKENAGNVFRGNKLTGSNPYDARFIRIFYAYNNLFENNTATMGGTGNLLQMHYSHYMKFYNNYFSYTGGYWDSGANPTAPERYTLHIRDGSTHNELIGNEIHSDGTYAMLFNQPGNGFPWGHDNLIKNNKFFLTPSVYNGSSGGVRLMTTLGNDRFEGNLIHVNTSGLGAFVIDGIFQSNTLSYFSNNTIVAENGIGFWSDRVGAVVVVNNNVYTRNGAAWSSPALNYTGDYNNFYREDGGTLIVYGGATYNTLTGWKNSSHDTNSINSNPLFVSLPTLNFNLQSNSPCIDAGDPSYPVPSGGGSRIDMGALEYQGGGGPPDTTAPSVAILSPVDGSTVASPITISGTATDNVGVSLVEVALDGGTYNPASGTNNWTKNLGTLSNGSHSVSARSRDAAGNTSSIASVNFTVNITNSCTPTNFVIDPPTLMSLAFAWYITGDDNRNCAVQVEYRQDGSGPWKNALPFLRVEDRSFYAGTLRPGNLLAGSILDLTPDTSYEVRLTLSDPDGGSAQQILTARTRKEPMASNSRTLYVIPGSGGGTGSSNDPFRGLAAASAAAQPGDTFILRAGTYSGPVIFTKDGTESNPIVFKGEDQASVVLDGTSSGGNFFLNFSNRKYNFLENLTIIKAKQAIRATGSVGMVIRNTKMNQFPQGTETDKTRSILIDKSSAAYICDNTIIGPELYLDRTRGYGPSYNVDIGGPGHIICHNYFQAWWDNITIDEACMTDLNCISWDFHNNILLDATDDAVEMDASLRNTRLFRNKIASSYDGISVQPSYGGPVYIFRNEQFNIDRSPYKFHPDYPGESGPSGVLLFHNSSAGEGRGFYGGDWSNFIFRNNLIYGSGGAVMDTTGRMEDLDYDGFYPHGSTNILWFSGAYYDTINASCDTPSATRDFCSQTGNERHSVRTNGRSEWVTAPEPVGAVTHYGTADFDFTLVSNAASIDRGQIIPNINDNFAGAAPDLGALERGLPPPFYGPRPQGPPDTTAPTISITSPANGATVSGTISVLGTASDNVGVSQVQVQVDGGTPQNASGTTNWSFSYNTSSLSNGSHTLSANARDAAGNNSSVSITVTVNNTMDTSPVISILSPLDGSKVKSPVSVNITGSDNMAVSKV